MSTRMKLLVVGLVAFLLGALLAQNAPFLRAQTPNPKTPTWQHGMNIKARKSSETSFEKAQMFGVEVFKDENNGNLIYISENGSISVVPGK